MEITTSLAETQPKKPVALRLKAEIEEAVKSGACLGRSSLPGVDLSNATLTNIDLRNSNLEGADLSGSDLSSACFRQAKMRGANLSHASLENAGMREVDLTGADLRGANLRNAGLQDAILLDANLEGAQLAGALLGTAVFSENGLVGARVGNAVLIGRRPMLTVGPLGPNQQFVTAWITNEGCIVDLGTELLDIPTFQRRFETELNEQDAREYRALVLMIETHVEIWR